MADSTQLLPAADPNIPAIPDSPIPNNLAQMPYLLPPSSASPPSSPNANRSPAALSREPSNHSLGPPSLSPILLQSPTPPPRNVQLPLPHHIPEPEDRSGQGIVKTMLNWLRPSRRSGNNATGPNHPAPQQQRQFLPQFLPQGAAASRRNRLQQQGSIGESSRVVVARAILRQAAALPLARRNALLDAAAAEPRLAPAFATDANGNGNDRPMLLPDDLEAVLERLAAAVRAAPEPPPAAEPQPALSTEPAAAVAGTEGASAAVREEAVALDVVPEYEQYGVDEGEDVRAVVSLRAATEAPGRAQVALTCVLDRSGSMSGELIALVRETCHFLIDQLGEGDYLGLISYADDVREDLPLLRMTSPARALAHAVVRALDASGSTALYDGLAAGVRQQMEAGGAAAGGRRVGSCFLFTDGQATDGPTEPNEILSGLAAVQAPYDQHVTVHTFGFGSGHSVGLLQAVAEAQSGVYYYIQGADDIASGFGDALGGLLSVVAKHVVVAVDPVIPSGAPQGAQAAATLAELRSGGRNLGGSAAATTHGSNAAKRQQTDGTVHSSAAFNDIFAEETREILLTLRLGPALAATHGSAETADSAAAEAALVPLARILLEYTDSASGVRQQRSAVLSVRRRPGPRPAGQLPAELVLVTAMRFETIDAIEAAEREAEKGDGGETQVAAAQALLDAHSVRLEGAAAQLAAAAASPAAAGGSMAARSSQMAALSAQTKMARESIKPRYQFTQDGIAALAATKQALRQQRTATSSAAAPACMAMYDMKSKSAYRAAARHSVAAKLGGGGGGSGGPSSP